MPIFTDFKKANLHLHNQAFWENVQKGWRIAHVAEKALNLSDFEKLGKIVKTDGVRLLYKGYSWWFTTSWDCELWEAVYTNGKTDEELNMHHAEYKNWEQNMQNLKFDVRDMGEAIDDYKGYFGDNKIRWAIRHATGKELSANKSYDVKQPLNGMTPVYRYYKDIYELEDLSEAPETTTTRLTNGFFRPGVFLQDEQGTRWMCIHSWIDSNIAAVSPDHKARFISFDGLTSSKENVGGKTGEFVNNADLLPESQVYIVAALLSDMSNKEGDWYKGGGTLTEIVDKVNDYYGPVLSYLYDPRDSLFVYENVQVHGKVHGVNFFYTPKNGRTAGTQPYLRLVLDASHVGQERTNLPGYLPYWYAHYFKKYNDGSGQLLDATHLFTCSNYITEARPVKTDKWSICAHRGTGQRDDDFKASDRYDENFNWKLFQNNSHKSAYHEPIMAVRYMEIIDESQTFQGTYNGKKYTILYEPSPLAEATLRYAMGVSLLQNFHNYTMKAYDYYHMGCFLDNELFEPNFYIWYIGWN